MRLTTVLPAGSILGLLLAGGCSSVPSSESPPHPIVGHWRSTAFEGADVRSDLDTLSFEFRPDGSFSAVRTLKGEKKAESHKPAGTYTIASATLCVTIPDLDPDSQPEPAPFRIEGDELVIEDPQTDSRVRFERVVE